jgi:hypothetical protein
VYRSLPASLRAGQNASHGGDAQNGLSAYHFRLLICDTFTGMRTEGCRKVLMRLISSDVGLQAAEALKTYKAPTENEVDDMLERAKDSATNLMRVCDLAAHYQETQELARNMLFDNISKSSRDVLSLISSLGRVYKNCLSKLNCNRLNI